MIRLRVQICCCWDTPCTSILKFFQNVSQCWLLSKNNKCVSSDSHCFSLFNNSKLQSAAAISVWPLKHLWLLQVNGRWFHQVGLCCLNPCREKGLIPDLHQKSITSLLALGSACFPGASEVWTFLIGKASLTASFTASKSTHSSVHRTDKCSSVNHLWGTASQMYCMIFQA